jgi:chaperonin cofactor prefoldin
LSEPSETGGISKAEIAQITGAVAGAVKKQLDPIENDVKYVRQQTDKIASKLEEIEKRLATLEKKCTQ